MATGRAGEQALNAHILHGYEVGRRGATLCAGHGKVSLNSAPAHVPGQFCGVCQVGEFINENVFCATAVAARARAVRDVQGIPRAMSEQDQLRVGHSSICEILNDPRRPESDREGVTALTDKRKPNWKH